MPFQRKEYQCLGDPQVGHDVGVGDEHQGNRHDSEVIRGEEPGEDDGGGQDEHLASKEGEGLPGNAAYGCASQSGVVGLKRRDG